MTTENKLIRDAGTGVRARQLLEDELLVEAFKTLEDAYTAGWRNTKAEDTAAREKLFLAVNIVGKVQEHLRRALQNGKFAEAELETIAATSQRKKRFGII